ncbi:MAG: Fic family protein [Candidatus Izimaplasma sp.]|nr:Fic family protein [Candidatus Izimaplasma bacterium]
MKHFDYSFLHKAQVPLDIYRMISKIYEYRGKQFFYTNKNSKSLDKYILHTKLHSTVSSNKIEGIFTTNKKSKEVIIEGRSPSNLVEQELLGYSKVFDLITNEHKNIDIKSSVVLQLHRDIYRYTSLGIGGKYKSTDNVIVSIDYLGNRRVIFKPLKAMYTENAMFNMCEAYNEEIKRDLVEPLLLIPIFILDFLSIHPFDDGNGRTSRLLTNLLLNKQGFDICNYISYEEKIHESGSTYYDVLNKSSKDWHDNKADYFGFIRYSLALLLESYIEFNQLFTSSVITKSSKRERIIEYIDNVIGSFSKREVLDKLPDISESTIERIIKEQLDMNYLTKIGERKTTRYKKR